LQAALVVVDSFLSDKKNKNDNDYRNQSNNDSILEKENSKNEDDNNDNGKPLAKLLIVDDDSDIVQVLKLGLQKNRFLVDAFTNPEEALQSFKSNAEAYCLMLLLR
jgi:PleD family two-component response regulator